MSDNPSHFTKGSAEAAARGAKGQARMREIAREQSEAIRVNSSIMLEGLTAQLGRAPTVLEKYQAESICSLFWLAAHARAHGKAKTEVAYLREAAILTNGSVFAYQANQPSSTGTVRMIPPAAPESEQHRTLDAEPGHFTITPGTVDFRRG